MAKKPSWLPLARRIRETVQASAISHRDRKEIQRMFQIGRSAAGNLLREILPTTALGQAHMVGKDDLLKFLDHVIEADDVTQACTALRAAKENVSRKRARSLVVRDYEPVDPAVLSPWLKRGHLEIHFDSITQLFDVLWKIACAIIGDGLDEFCRLYEPEKPLDEERTFLRAEKYAIDAEIAQMEADWLRLQAAKVHT